MVDGNELAPHPAGSADANGKRSAPAHTSRLSPYTTVVCSGCGNRRQLTSRQARRGTRCRDCRHPLIERVVDDTDRRWALKHFSDHEIIELAYYMFGVEGDPGSVYERRLELLGSKTV